MKRILAFALAIMLLIAPSVMAKSFTIQWEWNYNTEPDMAQYVMFHRVEGQGYDYNIPIKIIPCTITNGVCVPSDPNDLKVPFTAPDGSLTDNHFVVQAEDTTQLRSGDSNECTITVDLRNIPAPTMLQGVYNDVTTTVDLTWNQTETDRVAKWKLFNATNSGGPYTEVGELINDGTQTHTMSWNVPGDGQYYFTIVAFTKSETTTNADGTQMTIVDEVFSPDSNQALVEVKVHPSPVHNFKVKIRVY